ncbi:carbohydrate ABC transporter permease [Sulfobacillus thermosulfidooxidans]|uniref:carbohydrate ABC transporter permease n=1 Tax=Sulfobacillus thermosulfidooxidans TaxID=28034 RepID=UPI0002D579BF|nr:carbohydrate ABC transporter permease [Sulfobacillus thermosulfidooxidans]
MQKGARFVIYLFLSVCAVITIFPIWWIFATSLETSARAYSFPGALIPQGVLSNYIAAWHLAPWLRFLLNSLGIGIVTTALALLTSLLAAYGIVFLPSRLTKYLLTVILSTMMIPFYSIIVPDYLIIKDLGWLNTYTAQIVPFAANGFAVFMLVQFMRSLPKELRDAARIDGISDWGYLWHIVVPNLMPAIATVSIYLFLLSWNAFLWPLIVTNGPQVQPIQVGLANFLSTANGTDWTVLSAAAAITTVPVLILYMIAQRQIVESVSRSGIKG